MITGACEPARLRIAATWAALLVLLALARPTIASILAGFILVAGGEALRVWAAGHLHKTVELAVSGPYRYTRNPLYLGRLLIFTGLCIAAPLPYALHWSVLAIGWVVFFGYYLPRKERVEPARLLATHGAIYARYYNAVPPLLPSLRGYRDGPSVSWSFARATRNREHWMLLALALALAWLVGRAGAGG